MADTLFHAYLPLILWTGLGLISFRFMPQAFPQFLGRSLYWFGIPWEVLAISRQTDFSRNIGLAPAVAIASLGLGLALSWVSLFLWQKWVGLNPEQQVEDEQKWQTHEPGTSGSSFPFLGYKRPESKFLSRPSQGSFYLAATLGNTGFIGLGIVPSFVSESNLGWAVFYSITQNVLGTYGIGVLLASYFGRPYQQNHWWVQLRDVLCVPSLWAFVIGILTRPIQLPNAVELGLHASLWFVIPAAFLLMGMRLCQLKGWKSLRSAILTTALKLLLLPILVGIGVTLLGFSGEPRLALVLMAGMPSAFAGLILAEVYDLDRELIASSIAVSTIALLLTIPVWLVAFG